jgi:hypothetical protein
VQVGDLVDRGREDERLPERLASAALPKEEVLVPDSGAEDVSVTLRAVLDGTAPWNKTSLHQERVALLGALDTLETLRGFMALERCSAGRVLCLLGNHDLDLLRGNYNYFRRQKSYLLALLGLSPERIALHARVGLSFAELADAAPELAWLVRRPLLAVGAEIVAVHGGPTRALIDRLPALGINSIDQLGAWLDAAWEVPDHDAFREGASLLSPDQPEDDFIFGAGLRRTFLGLAKAKLLAVGHSAFLHANHFEPILLADGQVLKLDTGMKRAGPAWLVQRQTGCWSALREDGEVLRLTASHRAWLSAPSSEDIETRLYAVHGTRTLPWDNFLRAGSVGRFPSFRPGTHFSLGSLSNGMDTDGYYRFAILTPLQHLVPQLLNVSPMDTFVIGDVPLSAETILVVPEGTNTAHLSKRILLRTYSSEENLRSAVHEAIRARRGWTVTLPNDFEIDSIAKIKGLDINTSHFFGSFLSKHVHVSFGAHASSEVRNAGLFGIIDRLVQGVMRQYSACATHVLSRLRTSFAVVIVEHYLALIGQFLAERRFSREALQPYEMTTRQVRRWLAVVKADLRLREEFQRTLAGAPQRILQVAYERADDSTALAALVAQELGAMPTYSESGEAPEALFAAEVFSILSCNELRELIETRPEVVQGISLPRMFLAYSALRWLNIKTAAAIREKLDILIAAVLPKMEFGEVDIVEWLFGFVGQRLREGSNRKSDALAILALPMVHKYHANYGLTAPTARRDGELTIRFKKLGW